MPEGDWRDWKAIAVWSEELVPLFAAPTRVARDLPRRMGQREVRVATGVAALLAAGYVIHRLGRQSGATSAETRQALPGDELVPQAMWRSTRAITVEKAPADVWPWIVQMGFPSHRAGWYTPSWLDRLMWRIDTRSAEEIVPELQRLEVGDTVLDSEDGSVFFTVVAVRARRSAGPLLDPPSP